MKLLVEHLGLWPTPAKVITTAVTALYSYLAGRYFVFR
jgi:putative flippase GtrA